MSYVHREIYIYIFSRVAHIYEKETAGPSAVDGREGSRCPIREENGTRAKSSPQNTSLAPVMAAEVRTAEK